ncbi:MAG: hypothetical protein JNM18_16355 [Planctomycetaceae bacterium]|nr:hypothetical protein [Planctomycetaceae bacterium]
MARCHLSKVLAFFAVSFAGAQLAQAQEAKPAEGAKPKITFQEHVLPIFREHCNTCHSADQAKGGLALDTFAATMRGGAGGEVVFVGDLDSSRLWALVSHKESPKMPPEQDKIADAKLNLIKQWILEGALENSGSKVKQIKKPSMEIKVTGSSNKPAGPPAMPEGMLPEPAVITSRPGAITAMAASPWAPLVAISGQKQVLLYQSETFDLLGVLPFPEGTPQVLKFSRNGSLLLVGGGRHGQAGKVVLFDVKTGKRVTEIGDELDVVLAADVSNDHSLVALGGPRKMIRIYSVEDGSLVAESKKHTDWIYSIEFSPDGVLVASTDRAGGVLVWEAETGREFNNLLGHKAGVTDVSWRIDSNVLATCSEDGTIKLWEMENGREIKSWSAHDGQGVLSVEFAQNGTLVSTGRNKVTRAWKQDANQIKSYEAFASMGTESAVSFDGKRVFAGDLNGEIRVWNLEDGKALGTLLANPPTIAGLVDLEVANVAAQEKSLADAATAQKAANDRLAAAQQAVNNANKAADDQKRLEGEKNKVAQTLTQAQAAAKKANDAVAPLDAAVKRVQQDLAKLNQTVQAKTEAAKKLQAAKPDADKQAVEKAQKEVADATKAVQAKDQELKAAQAKLQSAVAEREKATAAQAAAQKASEEWTKAFNAAKAGVKSKADLDKLIAARGEAEKNVGLANAALESVKSQVTNTKNRLERAKQLKALQDKTRTAQASVK